MATQNFTVKQSDEWKTLPAGCISFTQNDGGTSFYAEATSLLDLDVLDENNNAVSGAEIMTIVPYKLDVTKAYHIRVFGSNAHFALEVEA